MNSTMKTTPYDSLSKPGKVLFLALALSLIAACSVGLVAVWVRVWPIL